jgi:hypothetical protein
MTNQKGTSKNKTTARVIDNPNGESLKRSVLMNSRMMYSRLIGALFLAGFAVYGVGFSMVSSVIGAPDFLSTISAHQTTLVLGAFLMLLNTVVDVGKGVLFFPILENYGKRTALTYLAALIVQVVLLDIGVLCLLMIVPLGQYALDAGGASMEWATALGSLLTQSNTMAYHIGQATLSVGAMFMCLLLFQTRLLPRFLAAWGVIGYVLHAAGAIAEIFGFPISLYLLIVGGLFEVVLGFWLIFKGFQPEAYSGSAEVVMTPDRSPASISVSAPATL